MLGFSKFKSWRCELNIDPIEILIERENSGEVSKSRSRILKSEINGTLVTNENGEDLALSLKLQLAKGEIDVKKFREHVNEIEERIESLNVGKKRSGSSDGSTIKPVEILIGDGIRSGGFVAIIALAGFAISLAFLIIQGTVNSQGLVILPIIFSLLGLYVGSMLSGFNAQQRIVDDLKLKIQSLPDNQQKRWEEVPKLIQHAVNMQVSKKLDFPLSVGAGSQKIGTMHELANKLAAMSPYQRKEFISWQERMVRARERVRKDPLENANGLKNIQMICPHCGATGKVRTKAVDLKSGIDGGKLTVAALTGGVSLLAGGGLSNMSKRTQAHCDECSNSWLI